MTPSRWRPGTPGVQRLRRLVRQRSARRSDRVYVIEGPTLVADALVAGVALEAVFVEPDGPDAAVVDAAAAAGVPVFAVAAGGLGKALDTVTPRPVAAIAPIPDTALAHLAPTELVVVLVDVSDPGNAGTLLRVAEAVGAGAVLCAGSTVDPYGPKCVRASAGALFRLDVVSDVTPTAALEHLGALGFLRVATVVAGGQTYDAVDLRGPVALVVGNEAHGLAGSLGEHPERLVDLEVTIPMAGRTESLNVAMAGAVLGFEVARQRRAGGPRP